MSCRKLFVNAVDCVAHIAQKDFVNDKGVTVTLTEAEAAAFIAWRDSRSIVVRDGDIYIVPGINESRLGPIFSIFDCSIPWKTQEESELVRRIRFAHMVIVAGLHVRPRHWRFIHGIAEDDDVVFDQLTIMSSHDMNIHQLLPSTHSKASYSNTHVFRAVQSNALLTRIQTISIAEVSAEQLFVILHFMWKRNRLKSSIVDYRTVSQIGVLVVKLPYEQLLSDIQIIRGILFELAVKKRHPVHETSDDEEEEVISGRS